MAHARDVIELFTTDIEERARELAGQLHALNQERQQTEAEIVRLALEECVKAPVTDAQAALVFAGPGWHRGVVGIVASRLVDRFHRPVFVLCDDPEEGVAQGSGRSIRQFHLLEALESMPDLFTRFGGHRQAAGVTLASERVAEFRERFMAYAAGRLTPEDFRPQVELDAALDLREISDASMEEVLALAPFGFGNPAPLFAVRGAEVAGEPIVWKDRHLRLNVRQNGRTLTVKGWNLADRIGEVPAGARVDVALCFEEDAYSLARGYGGWSAVLKDVRAAG
jgi:single-stranded-DNA-specific exonuclease